MYIFVHNGYKRTVSLKLPFKLQGDIKPMFSSLSASTAEELRMHREEIFRILNKPGQNTVLELPAINVVCDNLIAGQTSIFELYTVLARSFQTIEILTSQTRSSVHKLYICERKEARIQILACQYSNLQIHSLVVY